MTKLSIITVVKNGSDTILDTLFSLYSQTFTDFEHIVIDGSSTDNTLQIIQGFADCRTRLISESDFGIYFALNKGLDMCKGDIVGILHADDFYESNDFLRRVVDEFDSSDCDVLYTDLEYVSRIYPFKTIRRWIAGEFQVGSLKYGWMPPHPTVFIRKPVINSIGYYNTRYRISSDYDYILRLFSNVRLKFFYLHTIGIKMKIGGVSNRDFKGLLRKLREDLSVIRNNSVGSIYTVLIKSLRKLPQFFYR